LIQDFVVSDLTTRDIEIDFAGKYILTSLGLDVPEIEPITLMNYSTGLEPNSLQQPNFPNMPDQQ
jgi:hypothetical protein